MELLETIAVADGIAAVFVIPRESIVPDDQAAVNYLLRDSELPVAAHVMTMARLLAFWCRAHPDPFGEMVRRFRTPFHDPDTAGNNQ